MEVGLPKHKILQGFFYVNGKRFLQLIHEPSMQGHAFKYIEKTFKYFTPSLERMSISIT
jgi:hypothetical protein